MQIDHHILWDQWSPDRWFRVTTKGDNIMLGLNFYSCWLLMVIKYRRLMAQVGRIKHKCKGSMASFDLVPQNLFLVMWFILFCDFVVTVLWLYRHEEAIQWCEWTVWHKRSYFQGAIWKLSTLAWTSLQLQQYLWTKCCGHCYSNSVSSFAVTTFYMLLALSTVYLR